MAHDVTLILGDGVGPELAEATKMCIEATGVSIKWDEQEAGVDVMAQAWHPAAGQRDRIMPTDEGCLEGTGYDSCRHGIQKCECVFAASP